MKRVNSDVAYDYIRKRILSGEYPPGYPLMTEILSAEIKVSRTPVREALHKLQADGVVDIRTRLGASVRKMDLEEFNKMCEVRLALESHAAGRAALNHSSSDLCEIRLALEAMRTLTERLVNAEGEQEQLMVDELVREDVRFHVAIMTAAKNDLIKKEILRLHLVNRVAFGPHFSTPGTPLPVISKADWNENRSQVLVSHTEIYEAIAHGAVEEAKSAMENHIQEIIDKSVRAYGRSGTGSLTRRLTEEELAYNS